MAFVSGGRHAHTCSEVCVREREREGMTAVDGSGLTSDAFPAWLSGDTAMTEALAIDSAILDLCPSLTGTLTTAPAQSAWGGAQCAAESSAFAAVSPSASLSPPSPVGSCLSSPEWATAEGEWGLEAWAFPALVEGMAEARARGGAALAALEAELQNTGTECALTMASGEGATERENRSIGGGGGGDCGVAQAPPTKKRKRSEEATAALPCEEELCRMTSAQLAALRESVTAPLTGEEEGRLAAAWRRVKNREYSRVSRAKKSKRLEALEARVHTLEEERRRLAAENHSLREKLARVAAAFEEARAACTRRSPPSTAAAGVCLFAVLLCVGLVGLAPFSSAATHEAALAGRIHRTGRAILTAEDESESSGVLDMLWATLWPSQWGESDAEEVREGRGEEAVAEERHSHDNDPLPSPARKDRNDSATEAFATHTVACVEDSCHTEAWAPPNCTAAAAA